MKVKLKKKGKTKSYKMIDSWDDVTLEKWTELIKLEGSAPISQATKTISLLSDIPKKLIAELALHDVVVLLGHIAKIQGRVEGQFKDRITIEGIKYGFHPNLEDITLGEYADVDACIKLGLEDNMHRVMAILYRPILKEEGEIYSIESYDPKSTRERAEIFKRMKAQEVNSALLFFWTLGEELANVLPLYLMDRVRRLTKEQLTSKTSSPKNGVGSE